jgi:violaxanthin de-epoxidase
LFAGTNDAWDGYGGAFLYTRSPNVRPELFPRLEKAMERAKTPYQWKDFELTDNSCTKQTEASTVLREKFAKKLLITEEEALQENLTRLRTAAVSTIVNEEKEAFNSITFLEKELASFEKEIVEDVEKIEEAVVKDVEKIEKVVVEDVEKVIGIKSDINTK